MLCYIETFSPMSGKEKEKRSEAILLQKPLIHIVPIENVKKNTFLTTTTNQQLRILNNYDRLRTFIQLVWLNRFTGSNPFH